MNATRPEAETEYSRGSRASRRPARPRAAVLGLAGIAAVVLLLAEFTPVIAIRTVAAHPLTVRTIQTGPHHGWALVPIGVLGLLLAVVFARTGRRTALLGLAALGLAALGVAIGVDLPDVHATGLSGTPGHGLVGVQAHAAAGLYLETLGAVGLVVAAAAGALLAPRRAEGSRRPRTRWRRAESAL